MLKYIFSIIVLFIVGQLSAMSGSDIYEKYESSVFRIWSGGHGTGFLINEDGYILTNAHVTAMSFNQINNLSSPAVQVMLTGAQADALAPNKERFYVVLQKVGNECIAYKARMIAERRDLDMAIIKVDGLAKAIPIPFANIPVKAAEYVVAMGFPGLNDNVKKVVNLTNYLELQQVDDKTIFNTLIARLDSNFKTNRDKEISQRILRKYFNNEQYNKEESAWLETNGEKLFNVLTQLVNDVECENARLCFDATNKFPVSKKISEEFLELGTPKIQEGKTEGLPIVNDTWGLDNKSTVKVLQHSTKIRSGNSGGPLLNANGEVVGINTIRTLTTVTNEEAYATSSYYDEALKFLKDKNIKYYTGGAPASKNATNSKAPEASDIAQSAEDCLLRVFVQGNELLGAIINQYGDIIVPYSEELLVPDAQIFAVSKNGENYWAHKVFVKIKDLNTNLALLSADSLKNRTYATISQTDAENGDSVFSYEKTKMSYQNFAQSLGWGGCSKEEIAHLKELKNDNASYQKKYYEIIAKFLNTLPDNIALAKRNTQSLTFIKSGQSVENIAKIKSSGGKEVTGFKCSGNLPHGTVIFSKNNNLLGINTLSKDGAVYSISANDIEHFLKENNVPYLISRTNANTDDGNAKFINDYIYIIILAVAGLLLCILFYIATRAYLSRKNKASLPPIRTIIQDTDESKASYTPKRLIESGQTDFNVKIIELDSTISKIISILNKDSRVDSSNAYKLAQNYKQFQEIAEERLQKCLAIARNGNKTEAFQFAIAYPSLISLVNSLQFEKLEEWIIFCRRSGIPVPTRLNNDEIEELNSIIDGQKSTHSIDISRLRDAMASGRLLEAITILEEELAISPGNTEISRQILSLKNKYLDKEITQISLFAQAEKHSDALKRYEQLIEVVPETLQKKNPRWGKMKAYIDPILRDEAEKGLKNAYNDLKTTPANDWRSIYEMLALIREYLQKYPEFETYVETERLQEIQNSADNAKKSEMEHIAFNELVGTLCEELDGIGKMLSSTYSIRDISQKLEIIKSVNDRIRSFGFKYPDGLEEAVANVEHSINKIIAKNRRNKRVSISLSATVALVFLSLILYTKYEHNRKIDAYQKYFVLCKLKNTSDLLSQEISKLDIKNKKYLNLPEFIEVKTKLDFKLSNIISAEEDSKILEREYISFDFNKMKSTGSNNTKAAELAYKERYDKICNSLPEYKILKLNLGKKAFEKNIKKYAEYISEQITRRRNEAIKEIDNVYHSINELYTMSALCDPMYSSKCINMIAEFNKIEDPYAAKTDKSYADKLDKYIKDISNMQDVSEKVNNIESELLNAKIENYFDILKKLEDILSENNLSKSAIYDSLVQLQKSKDKLHNFYSTHYIGQNKLIEKSNKYNEEISALRQFTLTPESPKLSSAIQKLCNNNLRNIYKYNYEYYKESDSPSTSKVIYTISEADISEKDKPVTKKKKDFILRNPDDEKFDVDNIDVRIKYKGNLVEKNKEVICEFTPLESLFSSDAKKIKSYKIQNLLCYGKDASITYSNGETLTNGVKINESALLDKFYSELYDKKAEEIDRSACLLDNIENIMIAGNVSPEFKIHFLSVIISAMEKDKPYENGLKFSPTLMRLKRVFERNKSIEIIADDLYWVKILCDGTNGKKHIQLSDYKSFINEFNEIIDDFKASGISLREEADLCFTSCKGMLNGSPDVIGYINRKGERVYNRKYKPEKCILINNETNPIITKIEDNNNIIKYSPIILIEDIKVKLESIFNKDIREDTKNNIISYILTQQK